MLGRISSPRRNSGDTLIEVLFAVTVFSFVAVTAMTLMNQGTAAAQRSLETTLVRQQIDGQAEALRFLHSSYIEAYTPDVKFDLGDTLTTPAEEYYKIVTQRTKASASKFGDTAKCTVPANDKKDFVMNTVKASLASTTKTSTHNAITFNTAQTYSRLIYSGNTVTQSQGLWIEAISSAASKDVASAGYIDFHIRACWDTTQTSKPMNYGTIVRLYDPRG